MYLADAGAILHNRATGGRIRGVGGIVGMIATGVFAREVRLTFGSPRLLLLQVVSMVVAATYTFVGSWVLYCVTDALIPLRLPAEQERVGLDLSQHGESIIVSDIAAL